MDTDNQSAYLERALPTVPGEHESQHSALMARCERILGALRESEACFRAIFAEAAIGMAQVDLDGRPVRTNPAIQQMLGYTHDELRNMVFTEVTHPDDAPAD